MDGEYDHLNFERTDCLSVWSSLQAGLVFGFPKAGLYCIPMTAFDQNPWEKRDFPVCNINSWACTK